MTSLRNTAEGAGPPHGTGERPRAAKGLCFSELSLSSVRTLSRGLGFTAASEGRQRGVPPAYIHRLPGTPLPVSVCDGAKTHCRAVAASGSSGRHSIGAHYLYLLTSLQNQMGDR